MLSITNLSGFGSRTIEEEVITPPPPEVTVDPNRGYFLGGWTATGIINTNEIDGLFFSTETSNNTSATLAFARHFPMGASATTFGYSIGGGFFTGLGYTTNIDKFIYSTESIFTASNAVIGDNLGFVNGATAESNTHIYYCPIQSIGKMNISTDSNALLSSFLPISKAGRGSSNTPFSTIFSGGMVSASGQITMEKLVFNTDTTSQLSQTLTTHKAGSTGVDSSSSGYLYGGFDVNGQVTSNVQKVSFFTETSSNIAAAPTGEGYVNGVESLTDGFVSRSPNSTPSTALRKISFATDTNTASTASLATARWGQAAINEKSEYSPLNRGYWANATPTLNNTGPWTNTYSMFHFPSEVYAVSHFSVVDSRVWAYSTGLSSLVKGYNITPAAGTGFFAGYLNQIAALTFSNETFANTGKSLSTSVAGAAPVGNSTNGFLLGGGIPGGFGSITRTSAVQKLVYSSETTSTTAANIHRALVDGSGVSDPTLNIGYMAMASGPANNGNDFEVVIDKLNMSTEVASVSSAALVTARGYGGANNSTTKGFFSGGRPTGSTTTTEINGLTFSTETTYVASFSVGLRAYHGNGVDSSTAGLVVSGVLNNSSTTAPLTKINYTNETASDIIALPSNNIAGKGTIQSTGVA